MVDLFMLPRHYSYFCHLCIGFFYDTWLVCVSMVEVFMLPRHYSYLYHLCIGFFYDP